MVQGKQRGRPPLAPGKAKRASFNTRLRPSLKVVLEAAATQQGRSLSEEIEFRLERSLDDQRLLVEALELGFGRQVAGLMLARVSGRSRPSPSPGYPAAATPRPLAAYGGSAPARPGAFTK